MKYRCTIFLFLLIPIQALSPDYQKISTGYFDFYFTEYDRNVVEGLARESDRIAEKVMSDLGVESKGMIKVYITMENEFQKVPSYHSAIPDWVSGVAYHKLSLIVIKSPRAIKGVHYDLRKTFIHELTHVLLGSTFEDDEHIPRWLNEGVAMYESREWSFTRVSTITQAVLTDSLLPLSEITHAFPMERKKAELAYCQSFYLISFLITKYGREKLHRFIRYYSKERMLEEALLKVYSMNQRQLEEKWQSYLKTRFSWIPIITSTGTLWFLITLIFICGYIRKKRRMIVTLKQWKEEEI
ncbi:MAG: hypothetical protein AMJ42_03810 [Deltaproteobacteria bacterium DG_8]|nr:MAG: hypothetical protein AMJ42_03810 [Deltaproteobacteria bacterium DG_8]